MKKFLLSFELCMKEEAGRLNPPWRAGDGFFALIKAAIRLRRGKNKLKKIIHKNLGFWPTDEQALRLASIALMPEGKEPQA